MSMLMLFVLAFHGRLGFATWHPADACSAALMPDYHRDRLDDLSRALALMTETEWTGQLDRLSRTRVITADDRAYLDLAVRRLNGTLPPTVASSGTGSAQMIPVSGSAPILTTNPTSRPSSTRAPAPVAPADTAAPGPILKGTQVMPRVAAPEFQRKMAEQLARLNPLARELIEAPAPASRLTTTPEEWHRFHAHFDGVTQNLIERDDLAQLLKLTYVTDGSLLVMSSHGTAKSRIGQLIGRAVDRPTGKNSFFSLALTPDTTVAETSGGLIVAKAMKAETVRRWELGVLGHQIVFLDNFFDAKFPFLRTFLKQFNERQYTQGDVIIQGLTRVFVATTNQYLNEIYEAAANAGGRGHFDPRANLDRFNTIYWAADEFEHTSSLFALAGDRDHPVPELYFQDLDAIRADVKRVEVPGLQVLRAYLMFYDMEKRVREIEDDARRGAQAAQRSAGRGLRAQPPFRATRVFSTRSLRLATKRIAAEAVLRAQAAGLSEVTVTDADVDAAFDKYLLIQAPDDCFLEELKADEDQNPHLLGQIQTIAFERAAWRATREHVQNVERAALDRVKSLLAALQIGGAITESGYGGLLEFTSLMVDQLATVDDAASFTAQRLAALATLRLLREKNLFDVDEVP